MVVLARLVDDAKQSSALGILIVDHAIDSAQVEVVR